MQIEGQNRPFLPRGQSLPQIRVSSPLVSNLSPQIDGNGSIYLGLGCSCLYRMAQQHEHLPDKLLH